MIKKTYIQYDCSGNAESARYDGNERYALYSGIDELTGGWLLETGGEPVTAETAPELIEIIESIINDSGTPREALTAQDREYIADTLAAWGL